MLVYQDYEMIRDVAASAAVILEKQYDQGIGADAETAHMIWQLGMISAMADAEINEEGV